jgi:hypothetical protein
MEQDFSSPFGYAMGGTFCFRGVTAGSHGPSRARGQPAEGGLGLPGKRMSGPAAGQPTEHVPRLGRANALEHLDRPGRANLVPARPGPDGGAKVFQPAPHLQGRVGAQRVLDLRLRLRWGTKPGGPPGDPRTSKLLAVLLNGRSRADHAGVWGPGLILLMREGLTRPCRMRAA